MEGRRLESAVILAVGSEMLTPDRIDTNSLYLTGQLNSLGIEVVEKRIIGDDRLRLTQSIRQSMESAGLIVLSGGLGPTEDDVTRDALAAALNLPQQVSQEAVEAIAARFARMNRVMSENNRRQAMLLQGAGMLPNDRGTAPGQWLEAEGCIFILLPGPPGELKAMFELQCLPRLQSRVPPRVISTRHLRVAGMTESDLDALIAPVYTRYQNPVTTVLAGPGDIEVHLRARCDTQQEGCRLLDEVCRQLQPLLGNRLYTLNGEHLEEVIVRELRERKETVAVAESCTGGLIGGRLTDVPGSSQAFSASLVTYTNESKRSLLGIPAEWLENDGEVSARVVESMAASVRERLHTTYGISASGYAGPDGGTAENPVGTVFLGLAAEGVTFSRRVQFVGDRARIRALAAQTALDMLRRHIESRTGPAQG